MAREVRNAAGGLTARKNVRAYAIVVWYEDRSYDSRFSGRNMTSGDLMPELTKRALERQVSIMDAQRIADGPPTDEGA